MSENKKYDHVEFLMGLAKNVSNMGKPESDNNYGRAAMEIKQLRAALARIARQDYDSLAADPDKWPCLIAYKALGGRHKDGVALDPELLGHARPKAVVRDLSKQGTIENDH